MTKSISTEQTDDSIARVLEALAETLRRLAALSVGLSDQALRRPMGPGERSFAEVVAHLIHGEALSSESIVLALTLREPLLVKLHAERDYGNLMRFDRLPFADCMTYFRIRRAALMAVLESLPAAQWGRVVREEGKARKESVYWRARGMALHELEHLAELGSRSD
jgi:hypothetical protein